MMLSGFTEVIISKLVDEPHDEYHTSCVVINDFDRNVCRIEHNDTVNSFNFHIPTRKFGPFRFNETDVYTRDVERAEKWIWTLSAWCKELFE